MKKSLLKNSLYKITLDSLRILIPLITMPYIYRIFNTDIMGEIQYSLSISNYFFIFAGFGVYTYGLREVSRVRNDEQKRNRLFTSLFLISTVSTIFITIIYYIFICYGIEKDTILRNMLFINGIQLLSYIFYIEWINEAFENYKFISLKTAVVKILNVVALFIIVKASDDYYDYLFLLNIFIFINNIVSFVFIQKYIKLDFSRLEIRKYLTPLIIILLISNINILYTQLDRLVLGYFGKDLNQLAYYSLAQSVMSVLMTIVMALAAVSLPRLSYYLGQGDKASYEKTFNSMMPFIYFFLFPVSIGFILLSKEITLLFGGDKYLYATPVLIIFAIRMIFITIEAILSNQIIYLHGKEKFLILNLGICAFINIIFKLGLIYLNCLTATTAIFTTMVSEMIIVVLDYIYIKNKLDLKVNIFTINDFRYLILSLVFFIIGLFISNFDISYITSIFLKITTCTIFYLLILYLLRDIQITKMIDLIRSKLGV